MNNWAKMIQSLVLDHDKTSVHPYRRYERGRLMFWSMTKQDYLVSACQPKQRKVK